MFYLSKRTSFRLSLGIQIGIQRWAAENYVPDVVTRELDQLRVNSKIFGKFDPDTSATDIRLLLNAADVVERDSPQLSSLVRRICSVKDHRFHARGRIDRVDSPVGPPPRDGQLLRPLPRPFLKDLGLKRRGSQVLHGLGLIDSYHTLQSLSEALTKRAKVDSPISHRKLI
jgi:hypothetical protein